ncbi:MULTISPECIES: D-glycero-alpha-D-manno-heptose-1,7-bisphosphate 7-phosphatase [Gluconobacter]|uniref:D-glycero-alpha-D-manno-heptose-1,7-bisphosphate 7-phosphatase n=1 Tax=Gluconobacter TaxID=441 RepID=UPI0039EAE9CF
MNVDLFSNEKKIHPIARNKNSGQAAVFFDRDGVLNLDTGYPHLPDEIILVDGAAEAVAMAKRNGYLTIVVTNQSGVARGFFNEKDVDLFNYALARRLACYGGIIDRFYVCPYHPDASIEAYRSDHPDRKPHPGMIKRAMADFRIDPQYSFLVGDKITDLQAAEAAGIAGHLFSGGNLSSFLSPLLVSLPHGRQS